VCARFGFPRELTAPHCVWLYPVRTVRQREAGLLGNAQCQVVGLCMGCPHTLLHTQTLHPAAKLLEAKDPIVYCASAGPPAPGHRAPF